MGSDRARVSYDPNQQYRSVVMQQGRVTLEADWNEDQSISGEELRQETLEIVGPAATPDDGYRVVQTDPTAQFDFTVSGAGPMGSGTMYVGGIRLTLDAPVQYSNQSDWLDHTFNPYWLMPTIDHPAVDEFVYLLVREQEISAVEDRALLDVALAVDTAQRTRMIQHIVRLSTQSTDCAGGLVTAEAYWTADGLAFDPATMRLNPQSTLQASFQAAPTPDPCEPEVVGGYLGADNQLIRIQIAGLDKITGLNTLVWGFDDASFLYRVTIDPDLQTLTLQSQPVDAFHQPQANQAVEVLRSAAQLANKEYVASATGVVQTLATSYNPYTMQIVLPGKLPGQYRDSTQTPQAFLRVWQQQLTFTPRTAIELGTTGLFVTLDTVGGAPFHVGDYWLIAVRPSTSTQLYPKRYLDAPQPPDGPRMWACPLAAIEWDDGTLKVDEDCRKQFCNLIEACGEKSGGCCTVTVNVQDAPRLQSIVDSYANRGAVTICLMPGEYDLTEPLTLGPEHSNFVIEACPGGASLHAAPGSETAFGQGLINLSAAENVTLRGLTFVLPLVPLTIGQVQGYISIGLRPVGCSQLTIQSCSFEFRAPPSLILLAFGILAGGASVGLRLIENRFDGARNTDGFPIGFQAGFALFPSTILPIISAGTRAKAGASAQVVGPWLHDALFRDNFFDSVTVPVFVYADCGLAELESNTAQNCSDGFVFFSLPSLAYVSNMANVAVEPTRVETAVNLHNAIFSALANPLLQIASAAVRGYPLPAKYDLTKAMTVRPARGGATDISGIQRFYDRALPVSLVAVGNSATAAAAARVKLVDQPQTLTAHPLTAVQPVPSSVASLNQSYDMFEKQAFAEPGARGVPVALHFADNDVGAQSFGGFSGLGLFVLSMGTDDRDATNLMGSTFVVANATVPVAFIAGVSRCTVTGNIILNEGMPSEQQPLWSLAVFPLGVTPSGGGAQVAAGAITGNVLRGPPILPARNVTPPPPPPMDTWDFFNSIT